MSISTDEYLKFANAFVTFCTFFERYRLDNLYRNMTGANVGSFKSKKPDAYATLKDIAKFDLNKSNFTEFLATITNEALKHEDKRAHFSYTTTRFISDCRDLDILFCNEASNSLSDKRECFSKFMDQAEMFYEQNVSINDSLLMTPNNATQQANTNVIYSQGILTRSQQQIATASSVDNSIAESIINNSSFISFFKSLNDDLKNQLDNSVSMKVASEISRHFGVDKELTSDMIEKQQQEMSNTYNKILRKKNDILIFTTHLKRKTTPNELCHKRFPRPFLQHDTIFVDKY